MYLRFGNVENRIKPAKGGFLSRRIFRPAQAFGTALLRGSGKMLTGHGTANKSHIQRIAHGGNKVNYCYFIDKDGGRTGDICCNFTKICKERCENL
jgi:hypothetical protein